MKNKWGSKISDQNLYIYVSVNSVFTGKTLAVSKLTSCLIVQINQTTENNSLSGLARENFGPVLLTPRNPIGWI